MLLVNEVKQIYLGIQGENQSRGIEIDCNAWLAGHPNGSISIWHKRNGDANPSATGAALDGETGILTWIPTSTDTYVAGEGTAEIRMTESGVIKKSREIKTEVSPAVTLAGEPSGSDWQDYINVVDGIKGDAVTAKNAAEAAQAAAEEWATGGSGGTASETNNAKYYSEQAADSAGASAGSASEASGYADEAEAWATGGSSGTPTATNNAKYYSEQASGSAGTAAGQASAAAASAGAADDSAEDAEAYATGKRDGVDVTSGDTAYHNNAKYYANEASGSATAASESASAASGSATTAGQKATAAEAWATGGSGGTASATNNAKYYSEQAAGSATSAGTAKTGAETAQAAAEAWATGGESGTPSATNNAKYYAEHTESIIEAAATEATAAATAAAEGRAEDAEAYAAGTRGGEDVESDDPAYHNNAKYYSEQAGSSATEAQTAAASASAAYGTALLAPNYSTTQTYAVGDHVIYSGDYYVCNTAITTAEAWTAAHWTQETVGGEASSLKSAIDRSLWTQRSGTYTSGGYINTKGAVGSTVDVANPTSSSNYAYCILSCHKGDVFDIVGTGGDGPRQWCFTDTNYVLKSKAANNASTPVRLTAEQDGYCIVNAHTGALKSVTQTYIMDCAGEIEDLKDDVSSIQIKTENMIYAYKVTPTYLGHRYLADNGTPTSTTSNSWNLYKLDVSAIKYIELTIYKSSTTSLVCWSFSSVPFEDATLTSLNDSTKIVGVGTKTSETGALKSIITVPTGAKTMMIPNASAYATDYPAIYVFEYGKFDFLSNVPQMVTDVTSLNTKTTGLQVFKNSAYYRDVRWGAKAFGTYYHSADDGTSEFPSTTTAAQYFAKFNALVADYEGYADSHEMGVASDETTTMYYYTFYPKTNQDGDLYKRPKIIISAGQHGFEKTACFGIYHFAKNLLENWQDNPFLSYVRNHVQLIIMPLLNPYGFDHDYYLNANGVNLNRNWDTTGWSKSGSPGDSNYTGEEPLDQPETQYASAVILANLDAIWLCDYHNNGQTAPGSATGYLWHSFALVTYDDPYFEKAIQAAKWHIDETTGHLYVDYPTICSYVSSGTFTDNNAPSHQGLIVAYAREHNIMAATMEGGAAFIGNGSRYTSPIHHMNADLIGNWIRCILATYAHYAE